MRLSRVVAIVFAAAALAACHRAPEKPVLPPMLIDERGLSMPQTEAISHIAFRPFFPPGEVLKWAALPPLGGADVTANDGLGIEYAAGRSAMLLSQWPRHNFDVKFGGKPLTEPCKPVAYKADGLAWLSRSNVVMTLQPDGKVPPAEVRSEAKRLLAAGACR